MEPIEVDTCQLEDVGCVHAVMSSTNERDFNVQERQQRDRLIRVAIAVVAVIGALVVGGSSVLGVVLLVGAAIMVTAGVGFCPLYRLLGLSTDKSSPKAGARV
jgi:hypothetical protein